jgi:outer membrane receptor protein involved in Fe transport
MSQYRLSILTLGLLATAPAGAEESATRLDDVVVSGSREVTPLSATPSAIGKLDEQALKDTRATNITQAVNQIPGVHMVDLGNEQHSMSIRQPLTTNAVYQYLEDGVPIRPVGIFNHNALNEVNLTGAGEVEVMRGPSSSLYGSNAVGGAVNFLTKAPAREPEADLSYQLSSEGYQRVDTGVSGTLDDFGLRLAHYSARLRDSWRQYNEMDKDAVTLRGDYTPAPQSLAKLVYTYSWLDTQTPGSLNESDYQTNPSVSYQTFTYRRDLANRLAATLDHEWSGRSLSSVTLYGRSNEHGQNPAYSIRSCTISPTCPTGYIGNINENSYTSLGLDLRQRQDFDWAGSRLIAGLNFDRSPNSYIQDRINVTRDAGTLVYTGYTLSTRDRDYDVLLQNLSAYLQYEFSPVKPLRVVFGGRYDTIEYDFTNNMTPGPGTGAPSEVRSFDHFSPKAGLTYAVTAATSLYANYSQGFTPPEVSSLYARLAVPDLRPAVFDNYELGLRSAFDGNNGKVNVAFYRLNGKDEIVSYQIAVGNSEPRNAGKTRHTGIELGATYSFATAWETRLATRFSRHEYLDYDASATLSYDGKTIKGAPENITDAEIAWRPLAGLRLGLQAQHVSRYWMNDANTVEYPGHTLLHLRGSYRIGAWETWLKLMNLADKHFAYNASSSYSGSGVYNPDTQNSYTPGDPRTLWVGVAWHFGNRPPAP